MKVTLHAKALAVIAVLYNPLSPKYITSIDTCLRIMHACTGYTLRLRLIIPKMTPDNFKIICLMRDMPYYSKNYASIMSACKPTCWRNFNRSPIQCMIKLTLKNSFPLHCQWCGLREASPHLLQLHQCNHMCTPEWLCSSPCTKYRNIREISNGLQVYFEPKQSVVAECFHFHKHCKVPKESIVEFDATLHRHFLVILAVIHRRCERSVCVWTKAWLHPMMSLARNGNNIR